MRNFTIAIGCILSACFEPSRHQNQPQTGFEQTSHASVSATQATQVNVTSDFAQAWHQAKCTSDIDYPEGAVLEPSMLARQVFIPPLADMLRSPLQFDDNTPIGRPPKKQDKPVPERRKKVCDKEFIPLSTHRGRVELRVVLIDDLPNVGIMLRLWSSQVISGQPCDAKAYGEIYVWQYVSDYEDPKAPLKFATENCSQMTRNCEVITCKVIAEKVPWAELLAALERLNVLDLPGQERWSIHPQLLTVEAGLPGKMLKYVYDVKVAEPRVVRISQFVQDAVAAAFGYNPIPAKKRG